MFYSHVMFYRLVETHEMHGGGYFPRDEDLDTRTIGSAYDRYLQSVVLLFFFFLVLIPFIFFSFFFIDLNFIIIIISLSVLKQTSSMPLGEAGPPRNGGVVAIDEFMMRRGQGLNGRDMGGGFDPLDSVDRRSNNREPLPLPPDASNTLYVEGLPSNCSRREVSRILFSSLTLT